MNKLLLFLAFCFLVPFGAFSQITPVKNGDKYSITVDDLFIEVNASFGARITSFKKGDKEMLIQTHSSGMLGSTLWTSPQSEWGWPTLETTDLNAYSAEIVGDKMIFTSEEETGINGKKFKFIKTFSANEETKSIDIRYSMVNTGTNTLSNSLWSVTRVDPEGLTFWKAGDKDPWDSKNGNLIDDMVQEDDYYWLDCKKSNGTGLKFFADIGGAGWFGHVTNDNYFFVKSTKDVHEDDFAPGEGELEYWVDGGFNYIELENQSAYKEVLAGDTLHYDVTWYLCKLSDKIDVAIGNEELITIGNNIVDGKGYTSVESFEYAVELWPNPMANVLNVTLGNDEEKGTLSIYDISGKQILKSEFVGAAKIDVGSIRHGIYFYNLASEKTINSGKLIKY